MNDNNAAIAAEDILAEPAQPQFVALGGRRFRVIDFDLRTVRLDLHVRRLMRVTGLDRVLPGADEDVETYLARLQSAILDLEGERAIDLVASYLLPDGVPERDWTPALAAQIAAHIGACDSAEDRDTVITLCAQVAFGFFQQELEQLRRFERSLSQTAASPQGPSVH